MAQLADAGSPYVMTYSYEISFSLIDWPYPVYDRRCLPMECLGFSYLQ